MPAGPHSIPMSAAAALTLRWRQNLPAGAFNGARFDRVAFENILLQQGCAGIRIYMGLHDSQDPDHQDDLSQWTFVMVGTDMEGNDIITVPPAEGRSTTDGDVEQNPVPCPKACGESGPLNSP